VVKEHWREDRTKVHIEAWAIPRIEKVVKGFNPELIVEFGPYYGGMTKYFCEWCSGIPIYSVDAFWLIAKRDMKYFRDRNVTFMITSQLCENDIIIPVLLALPMRKFLFCDAAMRDEEVRVYSGYLRPGDLLGMHDWSDNVDKLEGAFNEFVEHPVNDELRYLSSSDCRFWIKRFGCGRIQEPVDGPDDELWKPDVGLDKNLETQKQGI